MKGEKNYVWEKKFMGNWIPLKGVRISEETANEFNRDTFRTNERYVKGEYTAPEKEKEEKSISDLSIAQLKAYAEEKEIDLGKAKKKDDILAIIRENE